MNQVRQRQPWLGTWRRAGLSAHELFRDLGPEEIQMLEGLGRRVELTRHTIHVPRDSSVCLVEKGRLKQSRAATSGKEVVLRILKAGDIFGELNVVGEAPYDFLLEALEDSVLLYVPAEKLRALAVRNAMLSFRLAGLIAKRRRRVEDRFTSLALKDVRARLATLLLELAKDDGVRDVRGILFRTVLSQRLMGELIGSSREMVNAILGEFREQGIIDVAARRMILREPGALQKLSA